MTAITFPLCLLRLALKLLFEGEDGQQMCAKIKYIYDTLLKCSKMQIEARMRGIIDPQL